MNADRRRILDMLADGRISAEEADRLIAALDRDAGPVTVLPAAKARAKYLRVAVETTDHRGVPSNVNVRVPMQVLRAGVRLAGVIPPQARDKVNAALRERGMDFDINQLKPENLDDLVDQLEELTVNVDQEATKVRVYCE
ncbi:hypothetical protein QO010_000327 [Caulobacter ginsengisoli]|uniref:YvlB/LiaX N-terminal domain-containing protein n=1 Tax=Caulobacter ginsengisoli TaxID=400775 RepID=A0ABU0IKP4_9CAUL|nr:hypothetical protein [Caulobacter ginsengisoli]MDQ0462579.1 hypothetical protein [Caulobacter ginsengisoli]